MSDEPLLSILVPMVPGRPTMVFDSLCAQAEGHPVEVLGLLDNRMRSIGLKRDALLRVSRGDYVAFVDDDDRVADDYVDQILPCLAGKPDAVLFDFWVQEMAGAQRRWEILCALGNEDEDLGDPGTPSRRGLWHTHVIKGDIARLCHFPDMQYGEDMIWLRHLRPMVRNTVVLRVPLYTYMWRGV